MLTSRVFVHGLAFWSPRLPGWPRAAAALRGDAQALVDTPVPPDANLLCGNQRRRAPEAVLMALQVAQEACTAAAVDPSALSSVFASAHGDLAIVDALCRSLARDPTLLSPTCFHHSVHNAASGYWAMAARNHQASSALAAADHSFAAGWLEAASQCLADQREILLVGCDTEAHGPLQSVNSSRGLLALALVLGPQPRPGGSRGIGWQVQPGVGPAPELRSPAARALQTNAMGDALPLFEALAHDSASSLRLPLSARLVLDLHLDAA